MKEQLLVVAVVALSVGQTAARPMTGLWTAEFDGRTFVRLELKSVDGAVAGGISLGNFEVDSQGVVKRADAAAPNLTPIFNVTVSGPAVTFFRKDGNDTDRFVLRLRDDASAELQFLLNDEDRKDLAASGVPLPKPIRLMKADKPPDQRAARSEQIRPGSRTPPATEPIARPFADVQRR